MDLDKKCYSNITNDFTLYDNNGNVVRSFNTIFNNYLIALGIWIVITGATFISVMKDKYNTCIAELISNMFKFYQKQRVFHYVVKEEQL